MTRHSSFPPNSSHRRQLLGAAAAASVLGTASGVAQAQAAWPAGKPIRIVLPSGAGGGSDIFGRVLAEFMSKELGTQVIIDNKAGANGLLAMEAVVRQPPDGYNLVVSFTASVIGNKLLQTKLAFDPITDFTPLAKIGGEGGNLLIVNPELPVKNIRDLIELTKTRKDLSYASWGIGSGGHLIMEAVKAVTGMQINHVPYKTVAQISPDVISNVIPVAWIDTASPIPHIKSGRVRAIATSGTGPLPQTPDVLPLVQQGVQLTQLPYYSLHGPKGMPDAIVQRIVGVVNKWLALPETATFYRDRTNQPAPGQTSPDQLLKQLQSDLVSWGKMYELAGIKPQ
ncbi:MAG: Bug family tripartite tricarboxylate transporter substrate binding protein [Burkholderiaceae bacterium]